MIPWSTSCAISLVAEFGVAADGRTAIIALVTPEAASILELFRSTGAYLQGHFQLTSGLHSAEYLQCAQVLQHPTAAEKLGRLLAEKLRAMTSEKIGLVVSPAL